MAALPLCLLVALLSYLLGAIPFGWLIARAKGVNLLEVGSKNIGATNVARILGKPWGVLVFVLDFSKGAIPVFFAGLAPDPSDVELLPGAVSVLAGLSAFVGHLFPIYLRFRGGKGVATAAGVIAILVPWVTVAVIGAWAIVLLATRIMSIASLTAALLLVVLRLVCYDDPWGQKHLVVTLFCAVACALVFARHHSNIRRLIAGQENRV